MKIYGDSNSGNCLKVKWVCDRLALPYAWIGVDMLKRETRNAQFLRLNSAGQVPAVEFDDGQLATTQYSSPGDVRTKLAEVVNDLTDEDGIEHFRSVTVTQAA